MVSPHARPLMLVFTGLPGVGKTTLGRAVAHTMAATFLRVDTIEAAVASSGVATRHAPVGYLVASAVARDQLMAERSVVSDAVNSLEIARTSWREVAGECGADIRFVQVVCSDVNEHRRRVESRRADLDGIVLPTWDQVTARGWEPLHDEHLTVDNVGDARRHVATILEWLDVPVRARERV